VYFSERQKRLSFLARREKTPRGEHVLEWYIYGLLTAVLAAAAAITIKHTLFKEHAMEFAATLALVVAAITAPRLPYIDYAAIPLAAYALILLVALLAATAYLFVTKAVRHMPISMSSPLLVLGPAFSAILAYFILGETLTPINIAGLVLVLGGVYTLEHHPGVSLKKNLQLIGQQRYIKYLLAALVLYATTGVADRYILNTLNLNVWDYLALVHLFIAGFFFFLLWLFHDGKEGIKHGLKNALLPIIIIALLTLSYRYTQSVAISMAEGKLGLVSALKRTSALLVIFVGGSLFHEKDLPQRIFATFIIIGGVLLIII